MEQLACIKIGEYREKYEKLLNSIDDAIFLCEVNSDGFPGRFLEVNEAACQVLGYSREELLEMGPEDISPPEGLEMHHNPEVLRKFQGGQVKIIFDCFNVAKDGTFLPVENNCHVFELNGKRLCLVVARDISERNKAEKIIKEGEEKYRHLVELLPDGICIHQKGKIVFINENGAKALGYDSSEELIGQNIIEYVFPEVRASALTRIKEVLLEKKTVPFAEEKLIAKDGRIIEVETSAAPFTYKGEPAVLAVTRDITGRKESERLLKEKEDIYRRYIEKSIDGVFLADSNGKYIDVNQAGCKMLGYTKGELLSKSISEVIAPDSLELCSRDFDLLKETGEIRIERTLIKKDGTLIDVEINAFRISDNEYVAFCHDVSERKMAEKALMENEYLFRLITENMLDLITLIDQNGRFKYVSPSYKTILGYNSQELLGKPFFNFIHCDDNDKLFEEYNKAVEDKLYGKVECRFRNANNSYVWLEIAGNILKTPDGEFQGAVLCSRDIGERKFSEKLLINSEKRYKRLVELSPDGILVLVNGTIVFANEAAKNILGIEKGNVLIGRKYGSIIHPDYLYASRQQINNIEQGFVIPLMVEKYIGSDGNVIFTEVTGTSFDYQNEPADLIVFRDITERKKAEEKLEETRKVLFEKEKLALIGQMSAGMAHEIRNPLTAIRGYVQLIKLKEYEKAKVDSYIDMVIEEIDRVNGLISDFLQLARPKEPNLKKQSIQKMISEFLDIFVPQGLLQNIQVEYKAESGLQKCLFDKDQIKQVLLNLCKNSIDAMPTGGLLKIATRDTLDQKYFCIEVEDNGCGISPTRLNQLGTPFYSDKEKGTGLGLSISYSIIRAHGGKIEVESTEGQGTKFIIFLPSE
ncbi:MAG: hypothetical protein VR72_07725 [Clostridiaceae bacterium BRH_c20a]|nr:MAG: hypothetical protein VR72_07725 [Clostridiaceae bacterium BRH_c20a]